MVRDFLDLFKFTQGGDTVRKYDFSTDNLDTTGVDSSAMDLDEDSPGNLPLAVYIKPMLDTNGDSITGTGDPVLIATLGTCDTSGGTYSDFAVHTQLDEGETLKIPLPPNVQQYLQLNIKSDGGGGSNDVTKGAVMAWLGEDNE